jgi:MinD-like ATPase involved in chromosome partitioning or flagellar assembly
VPAEPEETADRPAATPELDIDLREALNDSSPARPDPAAETSDDDDDHADDADSPSGDPGREPDRREPGAPTRPGDDDGDGDAPMADAENDGDDSDDEDEEGAPAESASPAVSASAPVAAPLLPEDIYAPADGGRRSSGGGLGVRLRRMLMSPPARREEVLDAELERLRVRGLARGVTVALGSIKGGVGKTTLTLSLADMLAEALRCGVLVVDADLEWGTAADSTPQQARHDGTLTDVLRSRERIESAGDLAPFLTNLPHGAQLLAGPTDPNEIEALHPRDMQVLLELLQRFFPIILLDLSPGIGLRGTIPRWAFGAADEIVAIATPTRGSLRRASRMLTYLHEHHGAKPITLALNMVPRRPDAASRRVIEIAHGDLATGSAYAQIPLDDALTRQLDAGRLELDELDQGTRLALKELARQLADSWCR